LEVDASINEMKYLFEIETNRNPIYWINRIVPTTEEPKDIVFTSWNNDQSFEYSINHQILRELQSLLDTGRPLVEVRSKLINMLTIGLLTGYEIKIMWIRRSITLMDGLIELDGYEKNEIEGLIEEFTGYLILID
jgi:hypothetical protein